MSEVSFNSTDAMFLFQEHRFTIARLRELNRGTLLDFPLPLMMALLDEGVDLKVQADHEIRRVVITEPWVDFEWLLIEPSITVVDGQEYRRVLKRFIQLDDGSFIVKPEPPQ